VEPADRTAAADDATQLAIARRIVRRDGSTEGGWLAPSAAFELVASVGIPVAPWQYVRSAAECAAAAAVVGTPCVVKGDIERVLHKSDEGAVTLDISNAEAAGGADADLVARFDRRVRGALVQAQKRIAELVRRVSLLAIAVPELQQLDLNPVIVDPAGCLIVDARAAVSDDAAPTTPLRGMRGHIGVAAGS